MDSIITVLQAYFQNQKLTFTGDVKSTIKAYNTQSLAPFLYYVYGDSFKNVYLASTLIQNKFFYLQREISALFSGGGISHFFIKGSILASLYPDEALRTRGDIDVVVKEEDYQRAKAILEKNGYLYKTAIEYHTAFEKNKLEVELHNNLFRKCDKFYPIFKDCFSHTRVKDKYELIYDENYHFLYALCHYNKHLMYGEGLRYLIDFYYMQKKWPLDYDFIINKIRELKLEKLFRNIQAAIYYLTGEKLPYYEEIDIKYMLDYLLTSGIHARHDPTQLMQNSLLKSGNSKVKLLLNTVFLLKNETRELLYPRLSKHIIAYPIMVIHRIFYLLTHRITKLKTLAKTSTKDTKDLEIIKTKLGIIEEV